ncbi:lectin BRA-3-like [Pollicipes pollicipes]|uniref:lectin BRA-3-like n=1 Tax=Pollicipes pollicipes TaxID=41117 RepID=UPI001884F681|nr:lectin BRA-3-like [Pollicipes pollicipes]
MQAFGLMLAPVLICLLSLGGAEGSCPTELGLDWKENDGFCYWYSPFKTSWTQASPACGVIHPNASLASVHNLLENAWIMETFQQMDMWLGLNDVAEEGQFVWTDGSPVDFTYWAAEQPDNYHDQDCAHMPDEVEPATGQWDDELCSEERNFLCKVAATP